MKTLTHLIRGGDGCLYRPGAQAVCENSASCYCAEGWVCEAHSRLPWPHSDCPGPGMPCVVDLKHCVWPVDGFEIIEEVQ